VLWFLHFALCSTCGAAGPLGLGVRAAARPIFLLELWPPPSRNTGPPRPQCGVLGRRNGKPRMFHRSRTKVWGSKTIRTRRPPVPRRGPKPDSVGKRDGTTTCSVIPSVSLFACSAGPATREPTDRPTVSLLSVEEQNVDHFTGWVVGLRSVF
jgi:hypothetical protein